MASQVEIANRALTKLGENRIISISDNLEAARVISSMWDIVRDSELREHVWSFSVKRDQLAAMSTAPSWGYNYQYIVPADFLRLLQANDVFFVSLTNYRDMNETDYKLENGLILTDLAAPLKIRYVASITDTADWDSAFVESFACRLAIEACERLTQNPTKRELALAQYKLSLGTAIRANAIENPNEPLPDDTWILSRI